VIELAGLLAVIFAFVVGCVCSAELGYRVGFRGGVRSASRCLNCDGTAPRQLCTDCYYLTGESPPKDPPNV
jgi:hypothetical protein